MFEQASCIPGLPTAQIRQANKSSERRFGRAKPAPVPIADVPEERLIGLPPQKSTDPKVEPYSLVELGCVAGTSPRSRVSHQKAPGALSEFVESCRDVPRESWDLEGSLAVVKKKKKKPKQKRNQLPRTTEFWDENVTVSKAPRSSPFAVELQKPDVCPVVPAEARKERSTASGSRASDPPKDAKVIPGSHLLEEQSAFSVPAPGQQAPKPSVPIEPVLDAKHGDVMRTEEMRDDGGLVLQSKGKRKEVPLQQVGTTKVGASATAKVPTEPMERDFLDKKEKRKHKGSDCADLMPPLSEAIHPSKVETPLETKPSELLLSGKDEEVTRASPRHGASSATIQRELRAPSGSLGEAAKKGGSCEKSQGVEDEALKEPALLAAVAPVGELPNESRAADEAKPASSDQRAAADVSAAEGALKAPPGTTETPATPLALPKAEGATALQTRKADGFSERPFLLSPKSDATKDPNSAAAADGVMAADAPEKNKGKGFIALEHQTGKDPTIAHGMMDRPKKKRGEGKVKKIRSFSEQVMLSEDVSKLTDGGRTGEPSRERTCPDKGRGFTGRGPQSLSFTHAYPAEKPKKRGSDGRSKKGERSFFQQPFLEDKVDPSGFPDVTDKAKGDGDKGRERGWVAAERFQENTSAVTEMQRSIELGTERPKGNVGKNETADLGALGQRKVESGREEAKHLAPAGADSQAREGNVVDGGKEAGVASVGESAAINSAAALAADKPRKRCSDGKRKEPEKGPWGQASAADAGVETSNLPSREKASGSTKETAFDKDKGSGFEKELLPEDLMGVGREVLEGPEVQGGNRNFANQLALAGHQIETAEPEVVNPKESWPVTRGKEPDPAQPLPEHGTDATMARGPARDLGTDKPKRKGRDVKGKKAENSPEGSVARGLGNVPAGGEEGGSIKQTQSFDKGKEPNPSPSASLLGDLTGSANLQAPALPLEPAKSHASDKEKCKKREANREQLHLPERKAGAEMLPPRDVERTDKSAAASPAPCSMGGGTPGLEQPAVADGALAAVSDRSKKRGYDGSSKKAKNAPEQPVSLEPKPKRGEAQAPVGSEVDHGMEDLVDENRNIKIFPTGPQMLWNNQGSDSEPSAQAAVAGSGHAGNGSSGFPKQGDEGARGKGLPPPEAAAQNSSKAQEMQKSREQPMSPGHKEPGKEVSKKDGKAKEAGSQAGGEAGKPLSPDHSVKQDDKSKDEVHLSPAAKVDDQEVRTANEKQNTGSASSALPQKAADSKDSPAPVGAKGPENREAIALPGEKDAGGSLSPELAAVAEGRAAAATPQVAAEALVEKKAEGAELGGGKRGERSSPMDPGSLGNKVVEAEAVGLNLTAAQTTKISPKDNDGGHTQPAEGAAAPSGEAHPKDAPALKPEGDKPEDATQAKEECEEKAVTAAKKERVKAAEQLKGYMRPTKSRGVPPLPARAAAPDREKQRQLKPMGTSQQRQDKGVCLPRELAAVIQTACVQDLAVCQCLGMNP